MKERSELDAIKYTLKALIRVQAREDKRHIMDAHLNAEMREYLEEAIENEDIHIDTWADEDEPHQLTKIKLVMTPEEEDKNANIVRDKDGNAVAVESMYGTKEESDVDVSLNLQAESQRGK